MKQSSRFLTRLCCLVLAAAALLQAQQAPQPIAPGERVAFFGDSITRAGFYIYYAQLYYALRQPEAGIMFFNAGVAGDNAGGAHGRWKYDVKPMNAQRVFVMFGMNDVGRGNYAEATPNEQRAAARQRSLANYERNMRRLVELLLAEGKTPVLVTPSPYDQYGTAPTAPNLVACNDPGLAACADIVRKLAAEKHLQLLDFHRPMTSLLQQHPELKLCGNDRVHPGQEGHLLMAALLLDAVQADGLVAEVELAADQARITQARQATVTDLVKAGRGLKFTYAPQTLPYPLTSELRFLDKIFPFTQKFNREMLRVTGLAEGTYALKANGRQLGQFTAQQLAEGINLALLETPALRQARQADAVMRRLRNLAGTIRYVAQLTPQALKRQAKLDDTDACIKAIDAWLEEREKSQDKMIVYCRNIAKIYREYLPKMSETMAKIEEMQRQMASFRPEPYVIVLE